MPCYKENSSPSENRYCYNTLKTENTIPNPSESAVTESESTSSEQATLRIAAVMAWSCLRLSQRESRKFKGTHFHNQWRSAGRLRLQGETVESEGCLSVSPLRLFLSILRKCRHEASEQLRLAHSLSVSLSGVDRKGQAIGSQTCITPPPPSLTSCLPWPC